MKTIGVVVACLLILASTALAADPNTTLDNASLATTLQVTATAHTAISFRLQTSAQANHCGITAGSSTDYSMDFGNVDGLGLSTNACANKFAGQSGGANGFYWATNYAYVARFSGFSAPNPKLEAAYTSTTPAAQVAIYEGPQTAVNAGAGLVALSSTKATIASGFTSSSTPTDRTLALWVAEGTGISGAYNAVVTFTLTPQ